MIFLHVIRITWATAIEINNRGFVVERSTNGQDWLQIGFVDGHNNSTIQNNYTFDDIAVSHSTVYYYRLRQVDYDGAFEYTDIVTGRLSGEPTFTVMDFIPNPATDKTNLLITGSKNQEITVTFYNLMGQKLVGHITQINKGVNTLAFALNDFTAGTYTALVSSANETYTKKIIIVR